LSLEAKTYITEKRNMNKKMITLINSYLKSFNKYINKKPSIERIILGLHTKLYKNKIKIMLIV
jgi:hypothetical protein